MSKAPIPYIGFPTMTRRPSNAPPLSRLLDFKETESNIRNITKNLYLPFTDRLLHARTHTTHRGALFDDSSMPQHAREVNPTSSAFTNKEIKVPRG